MGSKKTKPPHQVPHALPPTNQAQRLAVLYYWRPHNSEIGVPYDEWAAYVLETWTIFGRSGSPIAMPRVMTKPDAYPLYPDELTKPLCSGDVDSRDVHQQGSPRVLWIYPKV